MKFEAILEKHEKFDATGVTIPFDVEEVFGSKKPPVKVRINDAEYRSTIFRMKGKYLLVVPRLFREAAGVKAGERVTVEIERDTEERTVDVPDDLAQALSEAGLTGAFAKMSYTHRKEYANSVTEAKKPETRARRIAKAVEMIAEKRK